MAAVGFIGLGNMGMPMAENLIKAGHKLTGFDINEDALIKLNKIGGQATQSLVEVAAGKDVIITMLQDGNQVKQVCLDERGIYSAARSGHALHIDCSSIDVASAQQINQSATKHNLLAVDAPVSGGVNKAVAATLTFMVGGQKFAFEKARPYLMDMGQKIIYTGSSGMGQAAKICNNMILGISMIAVSEAFVLAKQLGLTDEKLFEIVSNSSGQCWTMSKYPPRPDLIVDAPANYAYQPGFAAAMMLKDLKLGRQAASAGNVYTPLAEHATLIYQSFIDAGFGNLDFYGIIK